MKLVKAYDTFGETSGEDHFARELFEVKFVVPRHMRNILLSTLRHNARTPARFATARMRTTYFDDENNTSFLESLDGEIYKRKYRLREYIDAAEGADYSLEIKVRSNNVTAKLQRLIFGKLPPGYRLTTFSDLIETFERLHNISLSELRVELPVHELYADTVIRYERARFDDRHKTARYNLDTNILVSPGTKNAVNGHGYCLGHDIFEIKSPYPEFFPPFMGNMGLEPLSFSKFLWGKETTL